MPSDILKKAYKLGRRYVPRSVLRAATRVLPRRIVVNVMQMGYSFKYAMYPRSGGEFRLLSSHEDDAKRALVGLIEPGDVVLDVGAHRGLYSLLLSRLVGEAGRVHAFEPHPENIPRLEENLALNVMTNVIVNPVAVSDRSGTARFNWGNSSTVASLKQIETQKDDWHEVPTVSIDDYRSSLEDSERSFRLIKVDVEGAEDMVLRGLERTIDECRPVVLLELHRFAFEESEVAAMLDGFLSKHDYRASVIELRRLNELDQGTGATHASSDYRSLEPLIRGSHTVELLLRPA